ncbi:metal ABC transporter substrate-binding protein [Isoalcanivorax indicus]|uniref:metal ABC transporter substrate-binding protein n=1 Tax=Isoalcanivorax indicus TaxID=2202653 RepID=UPI0013C4D317|nr:metal ABC transporter substrate-binding protein [Isoalcanivorax indicus]
MRRLLLSLLLIPLLLPLSAQATIRVAASVEPLSMLLRELLGDEVEVRTLLLPNQNPHHVSFTPGQARTLREADLVVWLGAEAEPQMTALVKRHGRAALALTDLRSLYRRDGDDGHVHHADDDHHHASLLDPHLWLYPDNMRALAAALSAHPLLAELPDWPARLAAFGDRLDTVEAGVRAALADHAEATYLSHHDPWAYFADAFGIRRPMIISHNVEASASSRRFAELSRSMAQQQVVCVMAEPEGRRALLERLCGDGCHLVEADPLGRDLIDARYTDLLAHLGGLFDRCLSGP